MSKAEGAKIGAKIGENIKKRIDANNAKIEDLLTPESFVLNKQVEFLLNENQNLREGCLHEFVDGVCIYCYTKEGE